MKTYRRFFLFILSVGGLLLLSCATSCSRRDTPAEVKHELATLDKMVRDAPRYDHLRQQSIDSTRRAIRNAGEAPSLKRWSLYRELGDKYKVFSSDSAVLCYGLAAQEAKELHSDSLLTISRIGTIEALSAAGVFSAAQSYLAGIDTTGMSAGLKLRYATAGRQLYSYMTSYVQGHERLYPEVTRNLAAFSSYLLQNLDSTDMQHRLLECERLVDEGQYGQAIPRLQAILKEQPQTSNTYGRAAFRLAVVYDRLNRPDDYARCLALAAQSDLQGSVKDGLALPLLAQWLYDNGDTQRAYQYINLSMKDASAGNARMRTAMIANAITVIDNAYKMQIEKSRLWITLFLILALLLLVTSAIQLRLAILRRRRIAEAQTRLKKLTKRQDSYIGHFIALCAFYSDKLSSMSRMVDRKISSGQTDDLLKMIKSGKFDDVQSEDFFTHFDKVFLDLYPDFVEGVNRLLRPECRIVLRNESTLTPELRIYAFVRLGVEESVKISRILRYSPATIYTYRNKMRNKAIDREHFEENIMKIGSYNN